MPGFPVPPHESERLAALRDLAVLDTPPEQLYDDAVTLAAAICRTPIALVNFVDADRQWGKALIGLESSEAPREASFCARTIVAPDGVLVVPDTLADPAWSSNAQVVGDPHLRFYAGASIVTPDGHAVGSLCVADRTPRAIDEEALGALRILARQVAAHLQLRAATARLRDLAIYDPLTGLPNRSLLFDRLTQELAQRRRFRSPLGVLFCDLDGFKAVNDAHGHEAGDAVLRAVAQGLRGASRTSDTVARLAGDEFVVLCPGVAGEDELEVVASRLTAAVAEVDGVGVSIGAVLADDADTPEGVLQRADAAMYRVKAERQVALGQPVG